MVQKTNKNAVKSLALLLMHKSTNRPMEMSEVTSASKRYKDKRNTALCKFQVMPWFLEETYYASACVRAAASIRIQQAVRAYSCTVGQVFDIQK